MTILEILCMFDTRYKTIIDKGGIDDEMFKKNGCNDGNNVITTM